MSIETFIREKIDNVKARAKVNWEIAQKIDQSYIHRKKELAEEEGIAKAEIEHKQKLKLMKTHNSQKNTGGIGLRIPDDPLGLKNKRRII
jgi:hypothetical protein